MELKILSATSNDLFLQPRIRSTDSDIDDNEPDCATLQVIIQLSIPAGHSSPSKLSSLSVSLVGYESIGFPRGGFEQNQPYSSKKNIEEATDLQLQAGNIYQFETSFAVNHNTAPYQRCKYGRLHQKLQAKATFPGLLGKKTIIAEKNCFFIQTVAQSGSFPYYFVHRGAAESIGPVFFGVRSQHLTVGGYLRITFSLASPSPNLQLRSLTLALLQQTTLKSRVRRNYSEQPPVERFPFFEADASQLASCIESAHTDDDDAPDGLLALAQNEGVPAPEMGQSNFVARLPNDSEARASSLPGGDVAIHMSHALELIIKYTDGEEGEEQTYRASWGLILPSCACRWQSMRLPSYTPVDPTPVPAVSRDFWAGRNEHESWTQCVCGESLETLLSLEDQAKREREPEPASEIWRQMLDMRLQQRLLRGRNSRSQSRTQSRTASPAISRRNSSEDISTPPEPRGRSGPGLGTPLDDEDELEFELQAREMLDTLDGDHWQNEYNRLHEQRVRRAKARNEYRSESVSPSPPSWRFFQTPRSGLSRNRNRNL